MRSTSAGNRPSLLDRAARVAFTFVVMNSAAMVALIAAIARRKVWR